MVRAPREHGAAGDMLVSLVPGVPPGAGRSMHAGSWRVAAVPALDRCLLLDVLDRLRAFGAGSGTASAGHDAPVALPARRPLPSISARHAPAPWAGAARGGDAPRPLDSPDMSEPAVPDRTGLSPTPSVRPRTAQVPSILRSRSGLLQRAQTLAEQGDWQLAANTFARVVGNNDPNLHVAALLGLAECATGWTTRRARSSAGSAPPRHPRGRSRGVPGSSWPRPGCAPGT